jgi:xylulokinase
MFLGLDIGTSAVKAVLIDETGRLVGQAGAPLSVSRPHPGWSEQNPDDWWRATLGAVDALKADHPQALAAVRGVGLSGQMHGATLLDAADRPLRPAILWNDGRAAAECAALEKACPRSREISGNLAMPGFTAPKLLWIAAHEPDVFAATATVLLPKDYVRLKLTGEKVSDMSDAAGTLWLDVGARAWSDELLAATRLDRRHMPRLVEGSGASGRLLADLASRWGMAVAPVVAGGGGDNAASACGVGAVAAGQGFVSLGTSGVLFVATDRFAPNTAGAVHAFCHALPATWHQMGVILSAAASLDWLAGILGAPPAELVGALGERPAGPSPVLFLPYLSGERTPHNDAAVRGAFAGLGHEHSREALVRAVLDGVAFALKDCADPLSAAGTRIDRLTAVGGGSRSRHWLSIVATVLQVPLDMPEDAEVGAAAGAARLGRLAATGEDPRAVCTMPPIRCSIDPEPGLAAAYAETLARWRSLYPSIRKASHDAH